MSSTESATILVVDDDALLQATLARTMRTAGLAVVTLLDGLQALDVAASEQPSLIVLDINMPAIDGRDILRNLKRDPRTAQIPVFMYTARGSQQDRTIALKLGADEYFDKPFDPQMLVRRIIHRLEKRAPPP